MMMTVPVACVGRTREMGQLTESLSAAADHTPSVVLLGGEAGMGKSWLVRHFAKSVSKNALILTGACIELGLGDIPYAPLIEALRRLVREVGEQRARELVGQDGSLLLGLITDSASMGLLGAPGAQVRVFRAALSMLENMGGQAGPVVLIFEDMHWADPSTLDLVAYLTRVKSHERVMLLCTYRSSLPKGHSLRRMLAEPEFTRRIRRISLSGFTKPEFRDFMGARAEALDPDRRQRIFDLSEGNPFFAELLLGAKDATYLPENVKELMRAQLEQLGEHAAAVTRMAAVAGRRVSDHLLAAVNEVEERLLDRAIREAIEAQILIAHEDETYEFRHALLRETVYESLNGRERRRMHAAMAHALATGDRADAHTAMEMAHHWYQAGRQREALAAAVRAGGLAAGMRAFQEAETLYRIALALWAEVPDAQDIAATTRVRVLTEAADAARWAGHVKQAVDWARNAIDELPPDADPALSGELYERLGSYQWEAAAIEDSLATYGEAERLLAAQPPSPVKSRVASKLAASVMLKGNYSAALQAARAALELARAAGARAEEGRALNSIGLALTMLGRADEGVPRLRDALRIAQENDHLEDLFRAYGNLGLALEHSGDLRGAVDVLLDGLAQTRALGLFGARQAGVLANNASAAMFLLGRWDEAVALLDEALEDRPVKQTIYMRLTRVQIDVGQGRYADAERMLAEVRVHPNNDPRFVGPLYTCMAEIAMWHGDVPSACAAVENGLDAVSHGENALVRLQLCAFGLRIGADECLLPAAFQAQRAAARSFVARLLDAARQAASKHPEQPEIALLLSQCEAEGTRAEGVDKARMWAPIAQAWTEHDQLPLAAYAWWRQAGAAARTGRMKPTATEAARLAHAAALQLGAQPLRAQIEQLAERYRLDLVVPASTDSEPVPVAPYDKYGLTDREVQVLREVCDGHSNTQIARRLFISESTVGVHVTHILRKLKVPSRVAAATLAHQQNFFSTR
jgi:DNA-binding CsgD family transcriptional regulator/tetratricopeptide (TPR) repeat protein